VTFVTRRFQPADLLLGGLEFASEFRLREAGLVTQGGELQGYVPRLTRPPEALSEIRVAELFLQK
jgi:hypothetical protein